MMIKAALMAAVLLSASARAGEFGDAGTFVPSGSLQLTQNTTENLTTTALLIAPQVDYFVVHNLAVGLGVDYLRASFNGSVTQGIGVAGSVGYNVALAGRLSLFPSVSASYGSSWATGAATARSVDLIAAVPLLLHFGNFFLGLGPRYSRTLFSQLQTSKGTVDGAKSTNLGLATTLGGWI